MTDPTTLSAAELDRAVLLAELISRDAIQAATTPYLSPDDVRLESARLMTKLVLQARRTEAAEREKALLTRALALLCAQGWAVSGHVHTVTPSLETDTVQLLLTDGCVVTLRTVPHPPEETPQP